MTTTKTPAKKATKTDKPQEVESKAQKVLAAENTNKVPKKICFDFEGTTYTLAFDRSSISKMEEAYGFDLNDVVNNKANIDITTIDVIFRGAFIKYHPFITDEVIDEIQTQLTAKMELYKILALMFYQAIESIFSEPADKGKAISWVRM